LEKGRKGFARTRRQRAEEEKGEMRLLMPSSNFTLVEGEGESGRGKGNIDFQNVPRRGEGNEVAPLKN